MRINCLSCGFKVELDEAYDDYEGHIKCFACGGVMEIKTGEGMVKSVVLAWNVNPPVPQEQNEPCRGR